MLDLKKLFDDSDDQKDSAGHITPEVKHGAPEQLSEEAIELGELNDLVDCFEGRRQPGFVCGDCGCDLGLWQGDLWCTEASRVRVRLCTKCRIKRVDAEHMREFSERVSSEAARRVKGNRAGWGGRTATRRHKQI